MNRVVQIAIREFCSTAITKGFVIGAFVVPAGMALVMAIVFPILLATRATEIHGRVALFDPTGQIAGPFQQRLTPEALAERKEQQSRDAAEAISDAVGVEVPAKLDVAARPRDVSTFAVELLEADTDLDQIKASLWRGSGSDDSLTALVVVDSQAIEPDAEGEYGSYEIYHKPRLDPRHISRISSAVEAAIRSSRIEAADLGVPEDKLRRIFRVSPTVKREVTEHGERRSLGELKFLVSIGFMILIFIPVIMGGQFLLTTMVEEKSNRVVEVLLSAVSAQQLMTGKILGQLVVGLSILLIYGTIGGGALVAFGLSHLIGPLNLISLLVFFLIAYCTIASFMAAIGSAVNDFREAQALQTPVMMVLMLPYLLAFPITANPSSAFSTIVSFVPIINPFAMMLRITSHEPPPYWQIGLSIAIGIATAALCLRLAAKVFRIGLLLHGKPPNFATLVRWVRMA
ncbi:MAG: ABC transporter permease [Planctomycetes bacterium]|nr:ABC transporter permease [Planctomycetota bacterium]